MSLSTLRVVLLTGFALALAAGGAFAQSGDSDLTVLPARLEANCVNNRGTASLILSLESGDSGVVPFTGQATLRINGQAEELAFSGGYAVLPLSGDRFEGLRLDYASASGEQTIQYGIYSNGTRSHQQPVAPWTSILPPLLAIALALLLREVIGSLLAGILFGALLLTGFHPSAWPAAITGAFEAFILNALADRDHAAIVLFSMLIGGMVAVISRNGGMSGVVQKLSVLANSARNAQLVTWLLGVAIFFDDYANTLVVGNTMRPVTDRYRISREKLAYLVDSTAAPVAAVAFITTWIGAELDYIDSAIAQIGLPMSAYGVFLESLRYAYYPFLTLAFMLMVILLRRDFGPMWKAEQRARSTGQVSSGVARQGGESKQHSHLDAEDHIAPRWYNALVPVLTVIGFTMAGLWITGLENLRTSGHEYAVFWENESLSRKLGLLFRSDMLSLVIGGANSYTALIWASSAGLLVAGFFSLVTRTLSLEQVVESAMDGFRTMLPALIILVLAWSLASVTGALHTGAFLASALSERLDPHWLPALTFLLSAIIAFSTGSSWSTMAILYPLVLPLCFALGKSAGLPLEEILPLFYNTTATVLAGAVLGDHCSPISDTTILSSLASQCHHVDHVRTQLPYALTVGFVSLLGGGILAAQGVPAWLTFPIGLVLLLLIVRYIGRPVPEA